jgi:pyruvate dehydrogenase E2 component (dihydrolipoamide acetyltransferase)
MPGERVKASPLARREAETRGVAIEQVAGTGPGGRITRKDVIDFAQKAPVRQVGGGPSEPKPRVGVAGSERVLSAAKDLTPPAAPTVQLGQTVPLSRIRQAIARSMSKSKQEIPHFYVTAAVNMTRAVELRKQINEAMGEQARVSFNDMVIKAAALAILKHPFFNATFGEQGIQVQPQVNIGMAVALESGLVAPAIPNADKKGLAETARETKALAERARAGHLSAQEYGTATFTVTNLGMYGVESFSAIITPPQAAALAVGAIQKEAIVKDGQVAVADIMRVTLSCDHRVVDGAMGAAYLAEVRSLLENPVRLLM